MPDASSHPVAIVAKRAVEGRDEAVAASFGFGAARVRTTSELAQPPGSATSTAAAKGGAVQPGSDAVHSTNTASSTSTASSIAPPSRASPIATLPDALLRTCLTYLRPDPDIASAQGVCAWWRAVAGEDSLWRELCRQAVQVRHPSLVGGTGRGRGRRHSLQIEPPTSAVGPSAAPGRQGLQAAAKGAAATAGTASSKAAAGAGAGGRETGPPPPPLPVGDMIQASPGEVALQQALLADAHTSSGSGREGTVWALPAPSTPTPLGVPLLPELEEIRRRGERPRGGSHGQGQGQGQGAVAGEGGEDARVRVAQEAARGALLRRAQGIRTALVQGWKRLVAWEGEGETGQHPLDTRPPPPTPPLSQHHHHQQQQQQQHLPFRLAYRALPLLRTEPLAPGLYAVRQEYIRKGVRDLFHPNAAPDGVLRCVYHRTLYLRPDGLALYALMPGEVGEAVKEIRRVLRTAIPAAAHPAFAALPLLPTAAAVEGGGGGGVEGGALSTTPAAAPAAVAHVDTLAALLTYLRHEDTAGAAASSSGGGGGKGVGAGGGGVLAALGPALASLGQRDSGLGGHSSLAVGLWRQEGPVVTLAYRSLGSCPAIAGRWKLCLTSSDPSLAHVAWQGAHAEAARAAGEPVVTLSGNSGGSEPPPVYLADGWLWPGHTSVAPAPTHPRASWTPAPPPPTLLRQPYLPGLPGRPKQASNDLLVVRSAVLFSEARTLWQGPLGEGVAHIKGRDAEGEAVHASVPLLAPAQGAPAQGAPGAATLPGCPPALPWDCTPVFGGEAQRLAALAAASHALVHAAHAAHVRGQAAGLLEGGCSLGDSPLFTAPGAPWTARVGGSGILLSFDGRVVRQLAAHGGLHGAASGGGARQPRLSAAGHSYLPAVTLPGLPAPVPVALLPPRRTSSGSTEGWVVGPEGELVAPGEQYSLGSTGTGEVCLTPVHGLAGQALTWRHMHV